jgi:hypothetical protein
VVLDEWELQKGADVTLFMESGIKGADRVLLVCTPTYASKANAGKGGVGYERMVVTGELAAHLDTSKFVCVLRSGESTTSIPTLAATRMWVDFREDTRYVSSLEDLLRDLLQAPRNPKPPLGKNPFEGALGSSPVVLTGTPRRPAELAPPAEANLQARHLAHWEAMVGKVVTLEPLVGGRAGENARFEVLRTTELDVTFVKESSSQQIVLPLDDLSAPWGVSGAKPRARMQRGELRMASSGDRWEYRSERTTQVEADKKIVSVEGHQFEAEMTMVLLHLAKRHGDRTPLEELARLMKKVGAVAEHIMDELVEEELVHHHFGIGADYGYTIAGRGTSWLIARGLIG